MVTCLCGKRTEMSQTLLITSATRAFFLFAEKKVKDITKAGLVSTEVGHAHLQDVYDLTVLEQDRELLQLIEVFAELAKSACHGLLSSLLQWREKQLATTLDECAR